MIKMKLGILFGGMSGEHEVSLLSAVNVIKAVDEKKYDLILVGINREGAFGCFSGSIEDIPTGKWEDSVERFGRTLPREFEEVDVVFPVLHGPYGEDGTIQGMLELMGKPYVGCDVLSSAIGMDKVVSKQLFSLAGIRTVPYVVTSKNEIRKNMDMVLRDLEQELLYPMFVKPANMGSSVGITKAHNIGELERALVTASHFDQKILVEQGVDCRELEVSVLGNDDIEASVVGEILPSHEFYDYESKYLDGDNSKLMIPAPITAEESTEIRDLAIRAFRAIGGCGMARVDFFIDKKTGEVLINEINTIPGFTRISMYPKLWEATGLGYNALVDRLIALALERRAEKDEIVSHGFKSEASEKN